jgi:hypothetical protein
LLVKEGFHPPIGVPIFQQYSGMIAEEIYPMINDNLNQEPMDRQWIDGKITSQIPLVLGTIAPSCKMCQRTM